MLTFYSSYAEPFEQVIDVSREARCLDDAKNRPFYT